MVEVPKTSKDCFSQRILVFMSLKPYTTFIQEKEDLGMLSYAKISLMDGIMQWRRYDYQIKAHLWIIRFWGIFFSDACDKLLDSCYMTRVENLIVDYLLFPLIAERWLLFLGCNITTLCDIIRYTCLGLKHIILFIAKSLCAIFVSSTIEGISPC